MFNRKKPINAWHAQRLQIFVLQVGSCKGRCELWILQKKRNENKKKTTIGGTERIEWDFRAFLVILQNRRGKIRFDWV